MSHRAANPPLAVPIALLVCVVSLSAQTTQGLISGRLLHSVSGRPIAGAAIEASNADGTLAVTATSGAAGYYNLPLLSPGVYRVRVTAPNFQSQEVHEIELPVSAKIALDFRLRPLSDVWEAGEYNSVFLPGRRTIVTFFGPDVDAGRSGSFDARKGRVETLESTVSEVIDSAEINNLPLDGRDVYALLITQPGVTSDAATGRGLGLSINGQRPSSSNYLLDGLENNNYLITGPLTTVAPEAIQEYRISTNNFSAEYGRTSGFLANAVTRSGANSFHGVAYLYLKNDALAAIGFQEDPLAHLRKPLKEIEPGFFIGGPVLKQRLFFSSALEHFRSRSFEDPQIFVLPATSGVLLGLAPDNGQARGLLLKFAHPAVLGDDIVGALTLFPPVSVDRTLAIERLDYNTPDGKDRVMGRLLLSRLGRPDFIWTPYKDFVSALHQNTWAPGVSYIHSFSANVTNEARFGYSNDDLHWNRPHPEIPTLSSGDGVTLPGSPAFYAYKNVNTSWELLDNVIWARGRHRITTGAGLLLRASDGFLTAGRDGQYLFDDVISFVRDQPSFLRAAIERATLPAIQQPDYNRTYHYQQYFLFAQDSYKVTSRLTSNYGLRYELYGGASNVGVTKDALVRLGPGNTLAQKLTTSQLTLPNGGDERLFGTDKGNWAVRAGAAYDLFGNAHTLLRGAYGIFYDRPFDNLWQNVRNNNFILPLLAVNQPLNFLAPIPTVLPQLAGGRQLNSNFPDLTLIDPGLRNGYVHSYFAGVQQRLTNTLITEVNALGSYGRNLITTDIINRDFSTAQGRFNPNLPDIAYRANQGFSDYNALTAVLRYRGSRGMAQASYTWSHVIDNQSEPLAGDFFNLTFTSIQTSPGSSGRAAFSRQFDPLADRGNSDFDQRHNLVLFSYWNLPAPSANSKLGFLLSNWTISELAAFRSGFPYTVIGTSTSLPGQGQILNNRPDIIDSSKTTASIPVNGGRQLLNRSAFAPAAPSALGNAGRNAFRGPGLYNIDLSLAKSFALRRLGESGRVALRADAFNALNHGNLNNPDALLTSPTFGFASFGRQGRTSGFPAVVPLNETPRQFQLSLKLQF
jgi:hypothetical protein